MLKRSAWWLAIAALMTTTLALSFASTWAKGGPSPVDSVVVSRPGGAEIELAIELPENYDHMAELYPDSARAAELTATLRYQVVVRYDWGNGVAADYAGSYDGGSLFFFPEPLRATGNVMERGGWYEGNPLFTDQLVGALAPAAPATGTGVVENEGRQTAWIVAGAVLAAFAAAAALGLGRWSRTKRA